MNWTELLQAEHYQWLASRYPGQDPKLPLLGIIGEAGEAAHALLSEYKELHHGANPRHTDHNAALLDALGDCIIYVCSWCNTVQQPLSSWNWASHSQEFKCNLDMGYHLVHHACVGYSNGFPTQGFADCIVAACSSRNTTPEAVALAAWAQVKGRIR